MLQPRFNRFRVILPKTMLPTHISDVYKLIMTDAGLNSVYLNEPITAIQESLVGLRIPGLHLNLQKQVKQEISSLSRLSYYTVRGTNSLMGIADDELLLEFRHIDGFHNHLMTFMAMNYMQSPTLQQARGEEFKTIGDVQYVESLSPNWELRTTYNTCVYSSIDSIEKAFKDGASEKTYQVRCKFITFSADIYCQGKLITTAKYNI